MEQPSILKIKLEEFKTEAEQIVAEIDRTDSHSHAYKDLQEKLKGLWRSISFLESIVIAA